MFILQQLGSLCFTFLSSWPWVAAGAWPVSAPLPFLNIDFQPWVLAKLQTISSQWSYNENHHVMSHHPDPNEKTRMEGANVPVSRHRHPRPAWKVQRVATDSLYLNNRPVAGTPQCRPRWLLSISCTPGLPATWLPSSGVHREAEVHHCELTAKSEDVWWTEAPNA